MEGIRRELETSRSRWALTLQETDSKVLTEDITTRIQDISFYLDSVGQILTD